MVARSWLDSSRTGAILDTTSNNNMERFFRDFRSGPPSADRKTGRNNMSRTLQTMLAETPLVKNLQNESYMKILLDGRPSLEAVFADIDIAQVRRQLHESATSWQAIPAMLKKMIREAEFPQSIARIFCAPSRAMTAGTASTGRTSPTINRRDSDGSPARYQSKHSVNPYPIWL